MEHIKELMAEYMALASKQDVKSKERRERFIAISAQMLRRRIRNILVRWLLIE